MALELIGDCEDCVDGRCTMNCSSARLERVNTERERPMNDVANQLQANIDAILNTPDGQDPPKESVAQVIGIMAGAFLGLATNLDRLAAAAIEGTKAQQRIADALERIAAEEPPAA